MNELAISVSGLGKQYRIGERDRHRTLRDVLANTARQPIDFFRAFVTGTNRSRSASETIWALEDVSFEVGTGEVVGIIGHNGAGKTTLLRILSRITEPTRGRVEGYGRVGSLLEVGTGFHPELTGRENIYLNGAILGMRKKEIDRKFDEIVAFAEVEPFLDTPVKHYSSGMYVRLAFAVAAQLEPEILLVDEVLAVGDIDFQKKCIGSMQSVASSGRTVLVVSHNMGLIESLCRRAIWLERGRVRSLGRTHEVVTEYATTKLLAEPQNLRERTHSGPHRFARFVSLEILGPDGTRSRDVKMGARVTLRMGIEADRPIRKPWVALQIRSQFDQLLSHIANREAGFELGPIEGDCTVTCHIESMNLLPDRYFVDLILADMSNTLYDRVAAASYFDVRSADVLGTGMPMGKEYGMVFFPTRWELTTVESNDSSRK